MAKKYYKNLHMSDFCSTFAAELITIMEKRTYIKPEIGIDNIGSDTFVMIQPSNSNIEPNFLPTWRPKNPTRTPVF